MALGNTLSRIRDFIDTLSPQQGEAVSFVLTRDGMRTEISCRPVAAGEGEPARAAPLATPEAERRSLTDRLDLAESAHEACRALLDAAVAERDGLQRELAERRAEIAMLRALKNGSVAAPVAPSDPQPDAVSCTPSPSLPAACAPPHAEAGEAPPSAPSACLPGVDAGGGDETPAGGDAGDCAASGTPAAALPTSSAGGDAGDCAASKLAAPLPTSSVAGPTPTAKARIIAAIEAGASLPAAIAAAAGVPERSVSAQLKLIVDAGLAARALVDGRWRYCPVGAHGRPLGLDGGDCAASGTPAAALPTSAAAAGPAGGDAGDCAASDTPAAALPMSAAAAVPAGGDAGDCAASGTPAAALPTSAAILSGEAARAGVPAGAPAPEAGPASPGGGDEPAPERPVMRVPAEAAVALARHGGRLWCMGPASARPIEILPRWFMALEKLRGGQKFGLAVMAKAMALPGRPDEARAILKDMANRLRPEGMVLTIDPIGAVMRRADG